MSIVQKIQNVVRSPDDPDEYECHECGHGFESHIEEESAWLSCPECDSKDVSKV